MEWLSPKNGIAFRRSSAILHLWLVFSLLLSPAGAPLAQAGVEAAQPTAGVRATPEPGRALPARAWPVPAARQGPRPPSDAALPPHPIRTSTMVNYYSAGSQRVAMREGSCTRCWLPTGHPSPALPGLAARTGRAGLGSTAVTANGSRGGHDIKPLH